MPGYDHELARPTNGFFDRLTPGRSFWRLNWTLLDNPALFQPTATRTAPSGDLADWYFRVERQTLRQLPRSRAIVFTIRTYVTSAAALSERDDSSWRRCCTHWTRPRRRRRRTRGGPAWRSNSATR